MSPAHLKAPGELIFVVDPDLIEARRDRAAFDRRYDGCAIADPRFFLDAADEAAADKTLVNEYVAQSQPPLCVEMRQPRRGPGAAGTAVDGTLSHLKALGRGGEDAGLGLSPQRAARRRTPMPRSSFQSAVAWVWLLSPRRRGRGRYKVRGKQLKVRTRTASTPSR